MRSVRLFSPTFRSFSALCRYNQMIRDYELSSISDYYKQERVAMMFAAINNMERLAADIQSPPVEKFLEQFESASNLLNLNFSYLYSKRKFVLINTQPISPKIHSVRLEVANCHSEKVDHPSIRKSLYFDEIKDMEQYIKIEYPKNCPKFFRDMNKKAIQIDLLNKKNPLGVPFDAPPLRIILDINHLFEVALTATLGVVTITSVRGIKGYSERERENGEITYQRKYAYHLTGITLPLASQNVFLDLLKLVGLGEEYFKLVHKLAYVGGQVQQLELLMNYYQVISVDPEHTITPFE